MKLFGPLTPLRRCACCCNLLFVASILSGGCGEPPPAPTLLPSTSTSAVPPPTTQAPRVVAPAPSGQVQTFDFEAGLQYDNVQGYTRGSRYLLYENGTFILHYPSGQYRGIYERTGDLVTFRWEGWNIQGEWGASGTVAGNRMTVRYNEVMLWTDFEDAIYRQSN